MEHARQNVICEDAEMDSPVVPDGTESLAMAGLVIN